MPSSNNTSREQRQHIEKCVQQKLLNKMLRPPIIDGALQMPVRGRTPHRYPEQLATPFWLPQKCKKKNGYWCSTGLCFFDQTRSAVSDHTRKWKICFFCPFGRFVFFYLLFAYFSSFFTLIRATPGFFVVFPNKSYTLIRATLGFEFFGPNKSYTQIRATFGGFLGSNESKTIRAT